MIQFYIKYLSTSKITKMLEEDTFPELERVCQLREQIHHILEINKIPLEEILRSHDFAQNSVEQLINIIASLYQQKQEQSITLGNLVLNIIDLLTDQIKEKGYIIKRFQDQLYESKHELYKNHAIIDDYESMISEYRQKLRQMEIGLIQANQEKQRFQMLYEQQLARKEKENLDETTESAFKTNNVSSSEIQNEVQDTNKFEVIILQYQLNQAKKQLTTKQSLLANKDSLIFSLRQKVKNEIQKNSQIQNSFKLLQQNYKATVNENQQHKNYIAQLEEGIHKKKFNKTLLLNDEIISTYQSQINSPMSIPTSNKRQLKQSFFRSNSIRSITSNKIIKELPEEEKKINLAVQLKNYDTLTSKALQKTHFEFKIREKVAVKPISKVVQSKVQKTNSEPSKIMEFLKTAFKNLANYVVKNRIKKN